MNIYFNNNLYQLSESHVGIVEQSLGSCQADPYFLQNFQCMAMFISAFCKICELNTERKIVFVLILKAI